MGTIRDIVTTIGQFLSTKVMPILVALSLLYFLFNIMRYVGSMGNERSREQFRRYSVNAIIALFIMLSVWGIIALGEKTVFNRSAVIPQLPTSGN